MKKDLSFLKSNIIAHRGYFDNKNIPENSLRAFELAMKKNYIIELDLHLLKDKKIVVFHDDNLKRMTGINKNIKEYSYDELKNIKLLNSNYNIPTLEEVLKLVDGKVPMIIEFKYDRKPGQLEKEAVKQLDNYKGKFSVKSFNPLSVNWFRKHRPEYIRGLLINYSHKNIKQLITSKMILLNMCKPDYLSCSYKYYKSKKIKK